MENLVTTSLIRTTPAPLVLLNEDFSITEFSESFREKFYPDTETLIGKKLWEVCKQVDSEFKEVLEKARETLSTQKKSIFKGSNSRVHWSIGATHEDGQVSGLMVHLQRKDLTTEKEHQLAKSLELAGVGGWEYDLISNELTWTKVTKEIHEVPEDYEPDIEQGINFYKEGIHRDSIQRLVEKAITTGEEYDTELVITTQTGREKWVRARGRTQMRDGKCVKLYGTFEDIDARKRADLRYIAMSERLSTAANAARVGIWDYDITGGSLYWDENMYLLYGIRKEDFEGEYQAWEACVHPEDKERARQEVMEALDGEKEFDTEFRVLWPSGQERHIRAIATVERDETGEPLRMVGTNWDITELKLTQLRLKRSEESFKGAFERSATGMALVGLDGGWIEVNDSLCNSLGYTQDELHKLTFQDITHPEDLDKDLSLLQEVVAGKRSSYQIEKRYYHKAGHLVYVILTVTGVKDINGNLTHFISQVLDISQRIEAEKRLKALVNVTKDQNSSLLNFAHIVSHNLRSHSTNMSMLTNFLDVEEDAQERKNIVEMLKSASNGLNETVQHLNEVVQVKTGALENIRSINLLNAVNSVVQNINAKLKEKNTDLTVKIPRAHFVEAVPAYLDSILLNLFTNALKYSHPDRDLELQVTSQKRRGRIILRFQDNGLGIDMDRHGDKIFGMYKTFHHHPEAKGIGLFITKNQVEAMNGSIKAESIPNEGTTFTIQLKEG